MTDVDDAHVDEYLRFTENDYDTTVGSLDPTARAELFEWHRRRSIHVHCWAEENFQPILDYSITGMRHR